LPLSGAGTLGLGGTLSTNIERGPNRTISVGVVGGGIGGLAAAVFLLRAGFDVHVFEQTAALSEVGAGIQVSPNASRLLHRLGMAEELAGMGVRPLAWHQRRWDDGRTLLRTPLADAVVEAFGFPHYQMHRADLLSALARMLPTDRLHVRRRFVALTDHGNRVEAMFEDSGRMDFDLLVGADGIHSDVRTALFGPESPRFTGCVAYRGLVPAERLVDLRLEVTAQVWMGPGRHFVHYFVQEGRLVNFVALIDRDTWTRESWNDRGEVTDVLAAYEGWHPQVRAILGSVDSTFIWALCDRAPLERWSVGRVTLLGDACHPMLPFMAQGSAQAIEDGAALTACLTQEADVPAALHRYEQLRLPRASRIQAMSAANKTRFHLPDGPEQEQRDALMATGSTDWAINAVAWIYAHDASTLDEPSRVGE
jgi:salicylate hydroxylase